MKKNKLLILILSMIAITAMLWNVLNEPGIKGLKGNMKETAFIRNEQNTGPVIRIYAVSVDQENWTDIEQYGNYMPHNKYGTTRVYFFLSNNPYTGKLELTGSNIQEEYKQNCIALYEKNGMSQSSIVKYPFRD
jgi:hypothetical protein